MARPRKGVPEEDYINIPRRPPATTVQARENQLIGLAVDVAERQLRDGTASSQVLTHFLKLATIREEMERDKLRSENELLKARVENLASSVNSEKLYEEAIRAFTSYRPNEEDVEDYVD